MDGVIYTRMSLDLREGSGVERQEHEARELAERLGYTITRVYSDNDVSATSGIRRPAYEDLLEGAAERQFGAIFVWALDRLYRKTTDLERIVQVLEPAGIAVHAVLDSDLDLATANGRMIARITAAVANAEVERLSARLKAHYRQQRRRGITPAARRPFGWQRAGESRFEPHPEEQQVVKDLYRKFLAGESLSSLARWLNDKGVRGSRGGQWRQSRVTAILRSPRNGGYVSLGGELVESADGPLVDRKDWWAAQKILTEPDRRRSGPPVKTWLAKRMWCDICGQRVVAASNSIGRDKRYPTFSCSKGCVSWKREEVLRRADEAIRKKLPEIVEDLRESFELESQKRVSLRSDPNLAEEVRKIDSDMQRLAMSLGEGAITFAQFEMANAGLMKRRQELEAALAPPESRQSTILWEQDVQSAWEKADILARVQICDALGVRFLLGRPRSGVFHLVWGEA